MDVRDLVAALHADNDTKVGACCGGGGALGCAVEVVVTAVDVVAVVVAVAGIVIVVVAVAVTKYAVSV